MAPIIRFEQVSKRYTLRHERARSFRDVFVGRLRGARRDRRREALWALRDVSFAIAPGEMVGLIGHNGAGKSTALKLISRVIVPNGGQVVVSGRVAALLELGTGFHPDLSGRDNIFLSGALAGMTRPEIGRKFDGIVAFSELEPFLDMPVKQYSSGMFARLAFAVSIHLDPEVLLVDEVLAVGDHSFQQKCLDRIAELKQAGVTICLVSHTLGIVRSLCDRAVWFDHGRLAGDGHPDTVVLDYLAAATAHEAERLGHEIETAAPGAGRPGQRAIRIVRVRLLDAAGSEQTIFATGDALTLQMEYEASAPVEAPVFGMAIYRHDGLHLTGPNTSFAGYPMPTVFGRGVVRYTIPRLPLLDGLYHITAAVTNRDDTVIFDYHDRLYPFRVINRDGPVRERYGLMALGGRWEHIAGEPPAAPARLVESAGVNGA